MLLWDAVNKEWKNSNFINKIEWGKLMEYPRELWALKQDSLIQIRIGENPKHTKILILLTKTKF